MLKEGKTIHGQHEHISERLPEFRQKTVLTFCVCVCVLAERDSERERLCMFKLGAVCNCDDAAFELKLPLCCVWVTQCDLCVQQVCVYVYKRTCVFKEGGRPSVQCVCVSVIIPWWFSLARSLTHTHPEVVFWNTQRAFLMAWLCHNALFIRIDEWGGMFVLCL